MVNMWSNPNFHGIKRNTTFPTQMNRETPQDGLYQSGRVSFCRVHDQARWHPRFQLMALVQALHLTQLTRKVIHGCHPTSSLRRLAFSPATIPKANAPPIHTSADRIVLQPHLAVLSLRPSSPGPTKKLSMDVRGGSVVTRTACHRWTAQQKFNCLIPWSRASRSSLIQGECLRRALLVELYHQLLTLCMSNVFLVESCRTTAEAKSATQYRKSATVPGCSLNAAERWQENLTDVRFCHRATQAR